MKNLLLFAMTGILVVSTGCKRQSQIQYTREPYTPKYDISMNTYRGELTSEYLDYKSNLDDENNTKNIDNEEDAKNDEENIKDNDGEENIKNIEKENTENNNNKKNVEVEKAENNNEENNDNLNDIQDEIESEINENTEDIEKLSEIPQAPAPSQAPQQPEQNSSLVGYNDRKSWWFSRNKEHTPPTAQKDINISQYDAYYLGDTESNVIYLTFDEGYENGYTIPILDVLKENHVKAAFFVTKSYIKNEPELVKRMVEDGHIVGNHSVSHPDLTTISDDEIAQEIEECSNYFEEITGQKMPKFFRPPEGVYSIRTLEKTQQLGYKTIFWSFAYNDWDRNNQPGKQAAYDMVMNNYHNGSIMLLHAVSQSNAEALDSILKDLKSIGYEFKTLDELP